MRKFCYFVITTLAIFSLGCRNGSSSPSIEPKEALAMSDTRCQELSRLVENDGHLIPTDKNDPNGMWVEFTWSKSGEPGEHTFDCHYKYIK